MSVKNGFTTLNRLLGKKNKGSNISKSSTNLSSLTSSQQIETSIPISSQYEQNMKSQLYTTNAPFEQTLRITVLLPKDQLYVARLGAKTQLKTLLDLVCENKRLKAEKYEFCHPVNPNQVFSCEETIGAVGLTELRLCEKSDNNFNRIIKIGPTNGRESLSSSEYSSRNSRHTLKTASPYSSTNSLNSSDSTGMSLNSRGQLTSLPPQATTGSIYQQKPPVAPARKKRFAPRPPIQNSEISNGLPPENQTEFKQPLARKEFHVSSPNLRQCNEISELRTADFHKSNMSVDCNGNTSSSLNNNSTNQSNGHLHCNGNEGKLTPKMRPVSMSVLNSETHYNGENGLSEEYYTEGSLQDISLSAVGENGKMPEPAPRKRIILAKKKAPAPPPRGPQPVATPRIITTPVINEVELTPDSPVEEVPNVTPKVLSASSISISSGSELSSVPPSPFESSVTANYEDEDKAIKINGSQQSESPVDVGVTPPITEVTSNSPEPIIEKETPKVESEPTTPKPTAEKEMELGQEKPKLESKLSVENSSDEDDHVKVYNLKLGKTIVKPITTYTEEQKPQSLTIETNENIRAESPTWSYPIPAPPNFADVEIMRTDRATVGSPTPPASITTDASDIYTDLPDTPITPVIKERSPVDFQNFNDHLKPTETENVINSDIEDGYRGRSQKITESVEKPIKSSPIVIERVENNTKTEIESPPNSLESLGSNHSNLTEDSIHVKQNGSDIIVPKNNFNENTESIEPYSLNNFKIQSYNNKAAAPKDNDSAKASSIKSSEAESTDDEKCFKKATNTKRSSLTLSNNVASQLFRSKANISRSDSFHSTQYSSNIEPNNLSSLRSTSYVSLNSPQKSTLNESFSDTNRRKSSSELSIGESPSLQSLIVMKSILNSRKNSLSNVTELPKSPETNGLVEKNPSSEEVPSPKKTETYNCDSSKENSPKNKIISQEKPSSETIEKQAEPEKKWKYQGPPSINLSTWSERPKVQVSIKNDSDYKFGIGKGSAATTRENRSPNDTSTQTEVSNAQIKLTSTAPKVSNDTPKVPFVRSVEYKKSTSMVQPAETNQQNDEQQNSTQTSRPLSLSNNLTLGRMPKINRTNFMPIVKGFKNIEASNDTTKPNNEITFNHTNGDNGEIENAQHTESWKPSKVEVMRSNSTVSTNILRLSTGNNIQRVSTPINKEKDVNTPVPFSQVTLRKTGLKEKILATNENAEVPKTIQARPDQPPCAKLEMKLTTTNTTTTIQPNNRHTIAITPTEIPPPPPPVIRSVVTKQNSLGKSACIPDTRDQLLSAIRNFNKNSLKQN